MATTTKRRHLHSTLRSKRAKQLLAHSRWLTGKTLGTVFFSDCVDPTRRGTDYGYRLTTDGWASVTMRWVHEPYQENPIHEWTLGDLTPPETLRGSTRDQLATIEAGKLLSYEQISRRACERWRFVKAEELPVFEATPKLLNLYGLPKPEPWHPDQADHDLLLQKAIRYYFRKHGWSFVSRIRAESCFKHNFRGQDGEKVPDAVVVEDVSVPVTPETLRSNTVLVIESLGRYSLVRVGKFCKWYLEPPEKVDAVHFW